jgi:hypothetical protein
MISKVDTRSARAVVAAVRAIYLRAHPGANPGIIEALFRGVEDMFNGRYLDYQPLEMHYHGFEHTLRAVMALAQLIEGRYRAGVKPPLSPRHFEIALAAMLLHDTGYLKLRADTTGTGAKYTSVHVTRSCAFAASYLPTIGFKRAEIDAVVVAVRSTGPHSHINQLHFSGEIERFIGCAVATADYLGQMAAADYIGDLPSLFAELEEADDFLAVPREKRVFHSAADLIAKTPVFWEQFVLPRLTTDCRAVYRYLADPYPDGPNAYLDAINRNMARARANASAPTRRS